MKKTFESVVALKSFGVSLCRKKEELGPEYAVGLDVALSTVEDAVAKVFEELKAQEESDLVEKWIFDRMPNDEEKERNYDGAIGSQFLVKIKDASMPTSLLLTPEDRWTDTKYNPETGDYNYYDVVAWREYPADVREAGELYDGN